MAAVVSKPGQMCSMVMTRSLVDKWKWKSQDSVCLNVSLVKPNTSVRLPTTGAYCPLMYVYELDRYVLSGAR